MEPVFQQLQRFMATPLCIFDFKPIDYPSLLQQHLITTYFQLNQLLKNTPHTDIVRLLHSSTDRHSDIFLPGLLYSMLLDFSASHSLFQTYMPILRSESWTALDRLMQQLIRQSFSSLKPTHRQAVVPILAKMHYYGQLSSDLLAMALKLIDCFDLSQQALNFNNHFLQLLQCVLAQAGENSALKEVLADKFFYKLLRMLSLLNLLDQQTVREYRQRCVAIAYRLFQLGKDRCLAMGWGASRVMRELESDESLARLIEECREELRRTGGGEIGVGASVRLGMVLPMRVQSALQFIIREGVSQLEVGVQMNWAFQRGEEHFQLLLIDILRYLLAYPHQQLPNKQGTYLLQWLFFRSCTNNVLVQLWKSELFHPCFCEPCPFPAAPERALRFLAYLLQANFQFGQTLLVYLLRQQAIPEYARRLKQLLTEANSLKILDIQQLLSHSRLSPRAKAQLRTAIGDSSFEDVEKFKEEEAQPYYNPLEQLQRENQMEIEFSPSQESEHFQGYEEDGSESIQEAPRGLRVQVEKMFAQDLGEDLVALMRDPTLPLYKQFLRKLMEEIKTFKLNGETETIDLFIAESAKLTYLLFQNQFQIHNQHFPKEENVVVHLLTVVSNEWRTNSFLGQSCKKLIRKLIDLFPTAEAAVWRQFLLFFRRGVVAQAREMKEWLIPREKCDYAMALLRELGPISKDMVDNAEQLKLPLA